jgi:hypothetical protein
MSETTVDVEEREPSRWQAAKDDPEQGLLRWRVLGDVEADPQRTFEAWLTPQTWGLGVEYSSDRRDGRMMRREVRLTVGPLAFVAASTAGTP